MSELLDITVTPAEHATPLPAGQEYASVAHVRDVEDLPELPIQIDEWTDGDKPCIVLVRALGHKERREVKREAKGDDELLELLVAHRALVKPYMFDKPISILENKHAAGIKRIALTSAMLGRLDVPTVKAHMRELLGLSDEPTD